ncbi:MAG TPA: AAA family ATPase, partial [Woeseiaceae bacterium]|nr:AAA family ATPase [Woeseiaceae bacterium]
EAFLADLISKHILDRGVLTIGELSVALGLTGSIIEKVVNFLRGEARVEVRPTTNADRGLSYALTERGRATALDAMMRSGYIGAAPVPLKRYAQIVRAQSVHDRTITQAEMHAAFHDVALDRELLDRLGPSLNSGRAIFLYGPAGTGKTYVSQKLVRLFRDLTLIPQAISVDDTVIQVFDPMLHRAIRTGSIDTNVMLDRGHDPRFRICERPCAVTGGELTAEMLEVRYDPTTRLYEAPLQLKANNGIFIIDDLGRQRISPPVLFNRWIVPLEEHKDYLDLGSGKHFTVPFDVILVMSTNIHPLELADEAFLRRIGYKIEFSALSVERYTEIWNENCRRYRVACRPGVLEYVVNELHGQDDIPLLPCHPRDLLGMAVDYAVYADDNREITEEHMRWAWDNYFVPLAGYNDTAARQ